MFRLRLLMAMDNFASKHANISNSKGEFKAQRDAVSKFEMSLLFTHLNTGSRGNATLVESGDAKILIDQVAFLANS